MRPREEIPPAPTAAAAHADRGQQLADRGQPDGRQLDRGQQLAAGQVDRASAEHDQAVSWTVSPLPKRAGPSTAGYFLMNSARTSVARVSLPLSAWVSQGDA